MSAPATAAFKTLFRNAHNVPLKCFVQFDASNEQVLEVKSLLQNHGADVSSYLQHALVILVDPPTTGGQLLIQEFANDQTRAILDFGWVKDCIRQGRCLGPAENWGGHRLPVTNVNDFFSFSGPPSSSSAGPPSAVSQASYAGNVGPYPLSPSVSTYQSQASTPGPLPIRASVPILAPAPAVGANALPSPAVSHPLPPSPISSTQRERSESKLELSIGDKRADPDPSASFVTATARRDEDVKTSQPLSTIDGVPQTPDGEPAPPDPSKMVLHHNGMGAKFTDDDIEYIRNYFIWSTKHFPNRTRGQVLEKIHEKMPYHSVVSVTQFMRRHPVYFAEFRKNDPVATLTAAVKAEKVAAAAAKTKEYPQEVPYDPGNADNEEPPKPPTNLIPFAKGYRFTTADDQFIIAYFNWHGKRFPGATKGMVLRDLAKWAPYRSLPSWTTYLSKHIHEWKKLIPLLENDMSEDEEQASSHGFEEEDSTFKPEPVAGMPDPGASSSSAAPEAHDADARRWNPPRRSSLTKPSLAPGVQPDDGDTSYDDRSAPPVSSASSRKQRSPRTSRLPQQMTVEHKQPKERRRSLAFTPQERQNFIEFLADHPWVWTSVAVPAEWLIGATTASAVWAKYQAMYPHRSDASWREYHKRNAVEFDPEAKRLRLMRLGLASAPAGSNIAPTSLTSLAPLIPPTEDLSDQEFDGVESEDGHDGVPFIPNQDELPASSFSYHPLPPAHESEDEEEDQLRTDEDEDMPSASNEPSTRGGSPDYGAGKKGSRKGRAYLPFSQEQKERFMDFLVQNPQVWAHATPNPAWVSWELQHQGKDSTWKILAAMPGMDNHSYKSWREYHRARAEKVDPEAKRRRLALEATRPSLAPSVSMESESSRKRSRSVESDMDIGTSPPPEPKRSKLDELDESMTMRSEA
ncbi:hypothetical protein FRB90_008842 [Tulasnella sp. 427]|nr:hypothetical protein FRB90_008842 [Tulasnella sp. 427]